MRLSGSLAGPATAVAAWLALAGCDARSLVPDGGTEVTVDPFPQNQLSDFEDPSRATILQGGTPPRNGYWYTYNDASTDCAQLPAPNAVYVGEAPAAGPRPGSTGTMALHAQWNHCSVWGAGIAADFKVPFTSALTYTGPKVAYDVTEFSGITVFAMATPGSNTRLRVKLPMLATTSVADGGACVAGSLQCGDHFGLSFDLPQNGAWKQITLRFSETGFRQEGWGGMVPWNPADVTGIQIQSADLNEIYDFWIDDAYFLL